METRVKQLATAQTRERSAEHLIVDHQGPGNDGSEAISETLRSYYALMTGGDVAPLGHLP